jgi:vacuolar-type H+-ATPase subunit E/Vma4
MANERFGAGDERTGRAGDTTGQVRETVENAAGQAKEKAGELVDEGRRQVRSQAEGQKNQATRQLGQIRSALNETAGNLRQRDQNAIAGVIDGAADRVETVSRYLQTHTVSDLISEAENFARREPALFIGGAMMLGVFASRFLKSSGHRHDRGRTRGGYSDFDEDRYRTGYYDFEEDRYYRSAGESRSYGRSGSEGGRPRVGSTGFGQRDDFSQGRPSGPSPQEGRPTVHGTSGARIPETETADNRSGQQRTMETSSTRHRDEDTPRGGGREGR